MSPLPSDPYIELDVPDAKTEQEFLRLVVQIAAMKYRALHDKDSTPPQTSCHNDIALRQRVG
ncbi:MAG: hypothetical protein CAF41_001135 [Nitrospira sp. CG24A]|nr:MAG: hypothetical protein CAF41_001135 [Nitrospira sp. CG24A]